MMSRPSPYSTWLYRARYHSVVDGDTVRLEIDMGFYTRAVHPIRLRDIDTPELYRGTDEERALGKAARQYVINWMQAEQGWDEHERAVSGTRRGGWVYLLETDGDKQTFNRYIGTIWRISDGACLNDDIVRDGIGVRV